MNTFGNLFRITTYGETHGPAVGVVIDNCPPGIELSEADIQAELDRRKPGQSSVTSPRKEDDICEILSGVFEGKTTGVPIAVNVKNKDAKSGDYENLRGVFRPSHADLGYEMKYGHRDHRSGGRASARETVSRVIGGAVAKKVLKEQFGVDIWAFSQKIGSEVFEEIDRGFIEINPLRMADRSAFDRVLQLVESTRDDGDSLGGVMEVRVDNPPVGLGSPVFGKLEAELARAIMSIPAIKGFEIGEGFALAEKLGSEANDPFESRKLEDKSEKVVRSKRNANGSVLGGISTGDTIWFRAAIKPTSSISHQQQTVNNEGETIDLTVKGRHDPILLPRAIPVLEAMTALVVLDHVLLQRGQCGV